MFRQILTLLIAVSIGFTPPLYRQADTLSPKTPFSVQAAAENIFNDLDNHFAESFATFEQILQTTPFNEPLETWTLSDLLIWTKPLEANHAKIESLEIILDKREIAQLKRLRSKLPTKIRTVKNVLNKFHSYNDALVAASKKVQHTLVTEDGRVIGGVPQLLAAVNLLYLQIHCSKIYVRQISTKTQKEPIPAKTTAINDSARDLATAIGDVLNDMVQQPALAKRFYTMAKLLNSGKSNASLNKKLVPTLLALNEADNVLDLLERQKSALTETEERYRILALIDLNDFEATDKIIQEAQRTSQKNEVKERLKVRRGILIYEQGKAALLNGKEKEALDHFKKSERYLRKVQTSDQMETFIKALYLSHSLYHLGKLEQDKEKIKKGLQLIQPYIDRLGESGRIQNVELFNIHALLLMELGQHSKALLSIRNLLFLNSLQSDAYTRSMHLLSKLGLEDKAWEAFERGFRLSGHESNFLAEFFQFSPEYPKIGIALFTRLLESQWGDQAEAAFKNQFSQSQYSIYPIQARAILNGVMQSPAASKKAKAISLRLLEASEIIWKQPRKVRAQKATPAKTPKAASAKKPTQPEPREEHWIAGFTNVPLETIFSDFVPQINKEEVPKRKALIVEKPKRELVTDGELATQISFASSKGFHKADRFRKMLTLNVILELLGRGQQNSDKRNLYLRFAKKLLEDDDDLIGLLLDEEGNKKRSDKKRALQEQAVMEVMKSADEYGLNKKAIASKMPSRPMSSTLDAEVTQLNNEMLGTKDVYKFWFQFGIVVRALISEYHSQGNSVKALELSSYFIKHIEAFTEEHPDALHESFTNALSFVDLAGIYIWHADLITDPKEKRNYYQKALIWAEKGLELKEKSEDAFLKIKEIQSSEPKRLGKLIPATLLGMPEQYDQFQRDYYNMIMLIQNFLDNNEERNKIAEKLIALPPHRSSSYMEMTLKAYLLLERHDEAVEVGLNYLKQSGSRYFSFLALLANNALLANRFSEAFGLTYQCYLATPKNSNIAQLFLKIFYKNIELKETQEALDAFINYLFRHYDASALRVYLKEVYKFKNETWKKDFSARIFKKAFPSGHMSNIGPIFKELLTESKTGLLNQLMDQLLEFHSRDSALFMRIFAYILRGDEAIVNSFTQSLQQWDGDRHTLYEALQKYKIKKPKSKAKTKVIKRYEVLSTRLNLWREILNTALQTNEPSKRKTWLKDHFKDLDEEWIEQIYSSIEEPFSLDKEVLISTAEKLIKTRLSQTYPYLPEAKRDELTLDMIAGEKKFTAFAEAEVAHYSTDWDEIEEQIPALLQTAKEKEWDQSQLEEELMNGSIDELLTYMGDPLKALLIQEVSDDTLFNNAIHFTKESLHLLNLMRQARDEKPLSFKENENLFVAEIIRHFLSLKYQFLGEELLETEDILKALFPNGSEQPKFNSFLDRFMQNSLLKFRELFPFYAGRDKKEIIERLFNPALSAEEVKTDFDQKTRQKVIFVPAQRVEEVDYYIVVPLRSKSGVGIKLYFRPIQREASFLEEGKINYQIRATTLADVKRQVARQEEVILEHLKGVEKEINGNYSLTRLQTNYGEAPLLTQNHEWPLFLLARGNAIQQELKIDIKEAVSITLAEGKAIGSILFHPFETKEEKTKILIVEQDDEGNFKTAHLKGHINFLHDLINLDFKSRAKIDVLKEVSQSSGVEIYVTQKREAGTLYFRNRNGFYGFRFNKGKRENIQLNGVQQEDLINVSLILAIANQNGAETPQQTETEPTPKTYRLNPYILDLKLTAPSL